jgi:hypothetical protein
MQAKLKSNISLDFDGVIHDNRSKFTTPTEIHDGPVEGALQFIREALNAGYGVHIHTARANDPSAEAAIVAWFLKHGLEFNYVDRLMITARKASAVIYIDDHGWRFEGAFPTLEQIEALKPWNRA